MKILVTGGCGYVGSLLVPTLLKKNFKVTVIDTQWFGNKLKKHKNLNNLKIDIRNIDKINLKNIDTIIHLAGIANDPGADLNEVLSWEINVLATRQLIVKAIKNKVKHFIYASSMSVYGKLLKKKANEQDVCEPLSCYGVSKLTSEKYLKLFCKKLPFIGLRMFNVYGPGQNMNNLKQGMVSIYLASILKKNKIPYSI